MNKPTEKTIIEQQHSWYFQLSRIPSRFSCASLENYVPGKNIKAINQVKEWFNKVIEYDTDDTMLALAGNVGLGKTHIAVALANMFVDHPENPCRVLFFTSQDILNGFIKRYSSREHDNQARNALWEDGEYSIGEGGAFEFRSPEQRNLIRENHKYNIDECKTADSFMTALCEISVLIIDDLGAEHGTEWADSQLDCIINERYANNMPTIVTFNNASKLTQRGFSRVCSGVKIVLEGTDYRTSKKV